MRMLQKKNSAHRAVSDHREICREPVAVSGKEQGMEWNQYIKGDIHKEGAKLTVERGVSMGR